jgi:hypothetical protein
MGRTSNEKQKNKKIHKNQVFEGVRESKKGKRDERGKNPRVKKL